MARLSSWLLVVLVVACCASSAAAQSYTLEPVPTLGGSYTSANSINAAGVMVGYSYVPGNSAYHAVVYDGSLRDLGTLGGSYSWPQGINDAGHVFGWAHTAAGRQHPFFYTGSGSIIDITPGRGDGYPVKMNGGGHVIGYSNNEGSSSYQAFVYVPSASGGTTTYLTLGGTYSYPSDINESGVVVGWSQNAAGQQRPFIYRPNVGVEELAFNGEARYVNAAGEVTGRNNDTGRSFLYTNGSVITIPDLGGGWSYTSGIAANGNVAGNGSTGGSRPDGGSREDAFLYNKQTSQLQNIGPGGYYSYTSRINEAGDVHGRYAWNYYTYTNWYYYCTYYNYCYWYQYTSYSFQERAFLRRNNSTNVLSFGGNSTLRELTDSGWAVGRSSTAWSYNFGDGPGYGFVYSPTSQWTTLTLGGSGAGTVSDAVDVNRHGDVVGFSRTQANDGYHGFLYRNGVTASFESLLPTGQSVLTTQVVIGDGGHIAGSGTLNGVSNTAFFLRPVTQQTPTLTWMPAPLTYGTPVGSTQLNAEATLDGDPVDGTFTYSIADGALMTAGPHILTVTFSPNDTTRYNSAELEIEWTVARAPLTVAAADASRLYGTPNPSFTGTITGLVSGDEITATYSSTADSTTSVGAYGGEDARAIYAALVDPTNKLGNYDVTITNGTLSILAAPATIILGNLLQTYDGTPRVVNVTTNPPALAGIVVTYDGAETAPVNAGTYNVTAVLNDANYKTLIATGSLVVERSAATVALSNLSHTYDGTAKFAAFSSTPEGLGVTLTYTREGSPHPQPINAGSYGVIAEVSDPNYSGSAAGTLTIGRAGASIAFSGLAQTFDGTPRVVTASTTPAGAGSISITYDGSAVPPTGAGSYAVTGTLTSENYTAPVAGGTLVVAKASATISLSGLAHTYDGTSKAAIMATDPADLSGLAVTYDGSPAAPTNAGSYAVVASLTNANYQAPNVTGSLVIAKAVAAIALSGLSQTYNGSPRAVTTSTTPTGVGTVDITYDGSPTAPTNAGSYAITAKLTSNNYEAPSATGTLVIAKASASIALNGLGQTYNATARIVTASTTPVIGDGTVAVTYDGSPTPPINAGSYAIVATLTSDNYEASPAGGTLVVSKAAASIALAALSHTYDGTPKAVVASTTPAGLSGIVVSYDGSAAPPVNAGGYSVRASLVHSNYSAADAVATLQIVKGSQSITFDSLPGRMYGDQPFSVQASASSGLPVSFAAAGSCTLGNNNIVTLISGGVCTVTATQPGNGNYLAAPSVARLFAVAYSWSGVLEPINADGTSVFRLGRTVPVKFQLSGASTGLTNLSARIYVAAVSNGIVGNEVEPDSTAAADSGNVFRYDAVSGQYVFNLGTRALNRGTWQIRIDLQDGSEPRAVLISLRN